MFFSYFYWEVFFLLVFGVFGFGFFAYILLASIQHMFQLLPFLRLLLRPLLGVD